METPFKHIVTEPELTDHADVFEAGTIVGQEVELTPEQYEVLGLKLHTLTEEDIIANADYTNLGLTIGDQVELPIEAPLESNLGNVDDNADM